MPIATPLVLLIAVGVLFGIWRRVSPSAVRREMPPRASVARRTAIDRGSGER